MTVRIIVQAWLGASPQGGYIEVPAFPISISREDGARSEGRRSCVLGAGWVLDMEMVRPGLRHQEQGWFSGEEEEEPPHHPLTRAKTLDWPRLIIQHWATSQLYCQMTIKTLGWAASSFHGTFNMRVGYTGCRKKGGGERTLANPHFQVFKAEGWPYT